MQIAHQSMPYCKAQAWKQCFHPPKPYPYLRYNMTKAQPIKNRVTAMTGTDYPIIQAPMGWIARAIQPMGACMMG